MDDDAGAGPVAHILVVGFHHKKGCQVEFCHPPIIEEKGSDCTDLPPQWKHLPCQALPDGSHNFDKDTIYFLLPGRDQAKNTMFGISCYKQMRANDLIRKDSEVTRGTVQKSVVVLSELPLFGLIDVKLQLITHAYFAERDFSKISILKEFFQSMKTSLPRSMSEAGESQAFVGLSLVDLVKKFRHKTLILFKLLLLERRVLVFSSPVRSLCACLLSVISLFPEMLQSGLTDAACPRSYQVRTPTVSLEEFGIKTDDYFNVEMSNVPNYRHQRSEEADKSRTLPSAQRKILVGTKYGETQRNRYSEGDRIQRLSRSHSCDSAIKSRDGSSSFSEPGPKMEDPATQSDAHDEEDELLDMIDEELFGTFFDKKRERLSRSLSQPDRTDQPSDSVKRLSADREDGATSPNEMSSLLSDDVDPPNRQAGDVATGHRHELEKQRVVRDSGIITANNNRLSSSSQEPPEESIVHAGVDPSRVENKVSRIEEVFRPNDTTKRGIESDTNARSTLESGVSSLGSQRWEGDPSPQTIDRITGPDSSRSSLSEFVVVPELASSPDLPVDDFGFPLSIFGKGSLFHPYMALQQHDLLTDPSVRCFVVGASNVLFKHKRQILDVIVEIESGEVTILTQSLRRQLSLTTADLRFSDYLVSTVLEHNSEEGMSNTGWEGGEEWIRAQFKLYLLSLLATCADSRPLAEQSLGDFNENFVAAWRLTHNYRVWKSKEHSGIDHVHTRHLCHGQLSMNDMKIRWNSAMQNSERGKNLNNVINRTTIAMSHTGKVVGEALTSAKSVMSTWLFGFGGAEDEEDSWSYEQE